MAEATADPIEKTCLKFKGNMIPLTTLELYEYSPEGFRQSLQEKIDQAPKLFQDLPILLSLEKFAGDLPDLGQLKRITLDLGLHLVGVRARDPEHKQHASRAGFALFPVGKQSRTVQDADPEMSPAVNRLSADAEVEARQSPAEDKPAEDIRPVNKVITQPVRSGQQIYAKGGDLIVLAPISAGAEVLADGNIHVYAPLRGRALAGVQGNTAARIFCQSLEAELVSIAGHYKISEDLQGSHWKEAVQISLTGEKLGIEKL